MLEPIKKMFLLIPNETQVVLVSATINKTVVEIADGFMKKDKVSILLNNSEVSLKGIKHYYLDVQKQNEKIEWLLEFLGSAECS